MFIEIFFEINGSKEEQEAVADKIKSFLDLMEALGDICNLDGTLWE